MLQLLIVNLVVPLIVLAVIWWAINKFPLPEPIGAIAQVIVVVLGVLILINVLLVVSGAGSGLKMGIKNAPGIILGLEQALRRDVKAAERWDRGRLIGLQGLENRALKSA
jgi:hypothetical protein